MIGASDLIGDSAGDEVPASITTDAQSTGPGEAAKDRKTKTKRRARSSSSSSDGSDRDKVRSRRSKAPSTYGKIEIGPFPHINGFLS